MGSAESVLINRGFRIKANKCQYEGVNVLTVLCGAEAWGVSSAKRRKVNVFEIKCLRSLVGVSRMDRVRCKEERRTAEIERELASRMDHRVLRWFGHVERMNECRMACNVLMGGGRVRGRPRLGWMDWCEGDLLQQSNEGGG